MTAVRFVEAAKYGATLFGYLLGISIVGGGGIGLAYVLAWDQIDPLFGPGSVETARLAGGAVLGLLGLLVLGIGLVSAVYKLVADSVAAGLEASEAGGRAEPAGTASRAEPEPGPGGAAAAVTSRATGGATTSSPEEPSTPTESRRVPGAGAGEAEQTADTGGTETTGGEKTETGEAEEWFSDAEGDSPSARSGEPDTPADTRPEPSAEEIAFGSGEEPETAETDEGGTTESADPSDPLADSNEDG